MFNHPDGSHYSQPTIWKEFQTILASAGLEHHPVHDLRHIFAVNSIMAGDDIKTLQKTWVIIPQPSLWIAMVT